MMAYAPAFHGVPGEFVYPPSSTSSSVGWAHEAENAPSGLPPPEPPFAQTRVSPSASPYLDTANVVQYSHRLAKTQQLNSDGYVEAAHGADYHYGKVWDSASLQERYDASSWMTTSSSEWMANSTQESSPSAMLNYDYSTPESQPSPLPHEFDLSHATAPDVVGSRKTLTVPLEVPPVLVPSHPVQPPPFATPAPRHPPPTRLARSPISSVPRIPPPFSPSPPPIDYVAHAPVPPEKQSTYSELMPNVIFLQKLREEELQRAKELAAKPRPLTITIPKPSRRTPPSADNGSNDPDTGDLPSPLKKRKRTEGEKSYSAPDAARPPQDAVSTHPGSSGGTKNIKEPRKPSLACTFCRERKISCGRPPPGSPDPTCNQCARRSFKCTYITEHNGKVVKPPRRRT